MRKLFIASLAILLCNANGYGQLMITKLLGKKAENAKLGYGLFVFYDIPVMQSENNSVRVELMDAAYYPRKDNNIDNVVAYINVKLGFKHVFSETMTGFYVEPQAGFGRVVNSAKTDPTSNTLMHGDGIALGLEGGYSVEIAESGNTLNFGVKFESDMPRGKYEANSLGFRVSYSFRLFRRREE